jgi:hypothetical protein
MMRPEINVRLEPQVLIDCPYCDLNGCAECDYKRSLSVCYECLGTGWGQRYEYGISSWDRDFNCRAHCGSSIPFSPEDLTLAGGAQ